MIKHLVGITIGYGCSDESGHLVAAQAGTALVPGKGQESDTGGATVAASSTLYATRDSASSV